MLEVSLHFGSCELARLIKLNQLIGHKMDTTSYRVGRHKWLQAGILTRLAKIVSYTRGARPREDWHDGSDAKMT